MLRTTHTRFELLTTRDRALFRGVFMVGGADISGTMLLCRKVRGHTAVAINSELGYTGPAVLFRMRSTDTQHAVRLRLRDSVIQASWSKSTG